jgi:hypothetical protein
VKPLAGGRQATKADLLTIAAELGLTWRGDPSVSQVRGAIAQNLARLHSALATLYPHVPPGVDTLRCQQRLRALELAAEERRASIVRAKAEGS